jgi:outer membrane protein assembly factor BamB
MKLIGCDKLFMPHNWPTFRGNTQRTGYYRGNSTHELTELLWKFKTGGGVASPAVADGMVFIGS